MTPTPPTPPRPGAHHCRIALVGDRSPHVRAHLRVGALLQALRQLDGLDLDAYWIATDTIEDAAAIAGFDGIWLLPGSPYRSESGAVTAVHTARTHRIPFLGSCGGFQHAVLEHARNVGGLASAAHAENQPEAHQPVISPLACSLVGHESAVKVVPGTRAAHVWGVDRAVERYHCAYGVDPDYLDRLTEHGLCFSGWGEDGTPRMLELPDHPFFHATLFQPELAAGARAHPIIRAFATAATVHAGVTE